VAHRASATKILHKHGPIDRAFVTHSDVQACIKLVNKGKPPLTRKVHFDVGHAKELV
jgi:hypothetical protein